MSARTEETRVFACCLISDTIMLKKRFYLLHCSEGNRKTLHNMHTFLSAQHETTSNHPSYRELMKSIIKCELSVYVY